MLGKNGPLAMQKTLTSKQKMLPILMHASNIDIDVKYIHQAFWTFYFLTTFVTFTNSERPQIRIAAGLITGTSIKLPDDKLVSAYLGIPYAHPPVAKLRFRDPVPIDEYDGDIDASEFGPLCPQEGEFQVLDIKPNITGGKISHLTLTTVSEYPVSEDCLTLNIYTPSGSSEKNKELYPVLFYIHGGSYFTNGGRLYPGQKLTSHDIILITINYRLGPLGFLNLEDEAASGNFGMLDQILALKWVQSNIGSFGGDKSKVTIFGNSAGGSSVGFHLLSPLSSGLFSSAISQSGSPLAFWAMQKNPKSKAISLANKVGCGNIDDCQELVECLREVEVDEIIKNSEIGHGFDINFAPSLDKVRGNKTFLPQSPAELLKSGKVNQVPFIMGITSDEITLWFQNYPISDGEVNTLIRIYTNHLVDEMGSSQEIVNGAIISHLVKLEYNDTKSSKYHVTENTKNIKLAASMMSDMELKAPSLKFVEDYGRRNKFPVYFYEFGYKSTDDLRSKTKPWMGAYHESELQFLFGFPHLQLNNSLKLESDRQTSDLMISLWSNFARYRDPTYGGDQNFTWHPFQPDGHKYFLYINESGPMMMENFQSRKMFFWNTFVPLLTKKPITPEDILDSFQNLHFFTYKIAFYSILCVSLVFLLIIIMISAHNAKQRKALNLCKLESLNASSKIEKS